MKKILIIGHARHGKDTAAEMLQQLYGYTFESSSVAAARIFLFDVLKEKYGYGSFIECFNDRVNRRAEWHDAICEYNKDDKARLAKDILAGSNMYVGMRSDVEVEECIKQGIFDHVIAVYDPRKPEEDKCSFNIDIWKKADFVVPNSEGFTELFQRLKNLAPILGDLKIINKETLEESVIL